MRVSSDSVMIPRGNLHLHILRCFIFVNVLYYFLRFQFNLDVQVLAVYAVLQLIIMMFAVLFFLNWAVKREQMELIDWLVLAITFQSLFLLLVTFFRKPELNSILYSIKDYVFPVLLFWYCRQYVRPNDWIKLYRFIAVIMTIVSIIYVLEFIHRILLGNPPFAYTQKIRDLKINLSGNQDLIMSYAVGNFYTLIRFEGPLSHNNVTGLGMAIGALVSIVLASYRMEKKYLIPFGVNVLALVLAGPRTAIFSLLVSLVVYYFLKPRSTKAKFASRIGFLLICCAVLYIAATVMDLSAYNQLYSFRNLLGTAEYLFTSAPEIPAIVDSLKNPLHWLGIGFPVPGDFSEFQNVVRSDDLFFIQLISMYGLLGIVLLTLGLFAMDRARIAVKSDGDDVSQCLCLLGITVAVLMLVTTLHTNALVRPQLYPLFFVCLASLSYCSRLSAQDSRKFSVYGREV